MPHKDNGFNLYMQTNHPIKYTMPSDPRSLPCRKLLICLALLVQKGQGNASLAHCFRKVFSVLSPYF